MPEKDGKPITPVKPSFFREGWRELGRKLERRKLRKQMAHQDREQNETLARLGHKAWEAKVGLADFPELNQQLQGLDARTDELTRATQKLESEKASVEEQRRAEVARFDAQRRAIEENKRPVDAALREAVQKQGAADREVKRLEGRLAAIAGEMAALEKQAATPVAPGQTPSVPAVESKRQPLLTEQSQVSVELARAKDALQSALPEVNRLKEESQRYANEITKAEAERKAALAQIDSSLNRLGGELQAAAQQAAAAAQERHNRFLLLGQGLYERKRDEPALAEAVRQAEQVEQGLGSTAASLRASLALTAALPRGTMLKFTVTLVLVPLVLIGLLYGAYVGWTRWREPAPRADLPEPRQFVNRYLDHSLSDHAAYQLANQLADAQSDQEVADRMLEAFRTIHLGVYSNDGRQILGGVERREKDFFLYDFQLKMLAHAFLQRNGMAFRQHSRMLGKALLELEDPALFEPILAQAVARRYQEAREKPDDPMSFLILLVDGLARRQAEPYSLDEEFRFVGDRILLDPLQSFLIMLDFFTRPPATPPRAVGLRWFAPFTSVAYAASPCDAIQGDQEQGYWGRGVDAATEAGGLVPGGVGKVMGGIGTATGVAGAIGDLLILYGMTIKLTPMPYAIHLVHDQDYEAKIYAQVTFDAQGVPDEVLKCGWLAGKQMPSNGAFKDVELNWNFRPDLPPYLVMGSKMWYGMGDRRNILSGGAGGGRLRTTTDEKGESSFFIQPSKCPDREGRILGQDYLAMVDARFVTKSIPGPGALGWGLFLKLGPGAIEYLMNGRSAYARFRAEWHKRRPKDKQY